MGAQAREAAELGQKLREARARAKELGDAVERERQATALAASELEARALAAALPTLCPFQQLPLPWPDTVPAVQPWPCLPRSSAVFPATCCLRPPCRTVGGAAQARGADKDAAEARAARAEAESRDLAQRLMEMKGREARFARRPHHGSCYLGSYLGTMRRVARPPEGCKEGRMRSRLRHVRRRATAC